MHAVRVQNFERTYIVMVIVIVIRIVLILCIMIVVAVITGDVEVEHNGAIIILNIFIIEQQTRKRELREIDTVRGTVLLPYYRRYKLGPANIYNNNVSDIFFLFFLCYVVYFSRVL